MTHVPGMTMLADLLTNANAVSRPIFLELLRLLDAFSRSGRAHIVKD